MSNFNFKMMFLLFFLFISQASFSQGLEKLAIGKYVEFGPNTRSMLITSNNEGESWFFHKDMFIDNAGFEGFECTNSFCLLKTYKGLYRSEGSLSDWQKIEINDNVISTFCEKNNCIAVGTKKHTGLYYLPFISISHDGGNDWSEVNVNFNIPPEVASKLTMVKCFDKMCIAAGVNRPLNDKIHAATPLIMINKDKGKSWNNINQVKNILTNIVEINEIKNLECINETCVISGTYHMDDNKRFINSHLMILVSHDYGQSWNFVPEIHKIRKEWYLHNSGLAVSNNRFIIVGYYHTHTSKPIILTSENADDWEMISETASAKSKLVGEINSIYCSGNNCFAVGDSEFTANGNSLLTSKDSGKSWDNVSDKLPMRAANFYTIDCQNNTCIAMGSYNLNYTQAIFLLSHDKGKSWKVASNNIVNMPENIYDLKFFHKN